MLGTDIGMPEFSRGLERVLKSLLQARRNRHLFDRRIGRGFALLRVLVDIAADVVGRKLQLLEERLHDVHVGQHVKHLLGVEFGLLQFVRLFGGALQKFHRLLAEGIGHVDGLARHRSDDIVLVFLASAVRVTHQTRQPSAAQ